MTTKSSSLIETLFDSVPETGEVKPSSTDYDTFLAKHGIEISPTKFKENEKSYCILHPFFDGDDELMGYFLPYKFNTDDIVFQSYNEARYALYKSMKKDGVIMMVTKYEKPQGSGYTPNLFLSLEKAEYDLKSMSKQLGLNSVPDEFKRHLDLWK